MSRIKFYAGTILSYTLLNCCFGCQSIDSPKKNNTIHFERISKTHYNINDTMLELLEDRNSYRLKYKILDSGRLETSSCKMFYIAIADFQRLPADTLREKIVLAIGKSRNACEIHVLESEKVYEARISSTLTAQTEELLKNSWGYDYILE